MRTMLRRGPALVIPTTMRAVVFRAPNEVAVDNVPTPQLEAGHALVRVRASMVCATDQKILAGKFPMTRFPHVPGHEFAGEIALSETGDWPVGTRVGVEVHVGCGTCDRCREGMYTLCLNYGKRETGHAHIGFTVAGGLAEYALVPVAALHVLPDGVSFEEGAWTDNLGVALWSLERGRLAGGEHVVLIGSGAIRPRAPPPAPGVRGRRLTLLGPRGGRRRAEGPAGRGGGSAGAGP